ncbi:MAG TPA: hypothetical protein VGR70_07425 [Stellaceae bacterium]|nr:hypothetical protein [Stellaceae bacterium]
MINRGVFLLAAGCVFFGAVILVELSGGMTHPVPPAAVPPGVDNTPAMASDVAADPNRLVPTILARPLFSPTRQPPPATGNEVSGNFELGGARLTGIVIGPGERLAIFDMKGSKPVVLNEGETVSGWRVDSIAPSEVSLVGPGGTKTLQPKLDPAHTVSNVPPASAARAQPQPPSDAPIRPRGPGREPQR